MPVQDMTRNLVCDADGIIVAETVFRCMRCSLVLQCVQQAKEHYYTHHMDDDEMMNGNGTSDEQERKTSQMPKLRKEHNPIQLSSHTSVAVNDSIPFTGHADPVSSSLSDAHPTVVKALTAGVSILQSTDQSFNNRVTGKCRVTVHGLVLMSLIPFPAQITEALTTINAVSFVHQKVAEEQVVAVVTAVTANQSKCNALSVVSFAHTCIVDTDIRHVRSVTVSTVPSSRIRPSFPVQHWESVVSPSEVDVVPVGS